MQKALLFYPPIGRYLRGEDRSQAVVDTSTATNLRAPIDLAYIAACLQNVGVKVTIRDYPALGYTDADWEQFQNDLKLLRPDFVVMSTTAATIDKDVKALEVIKKFDPQILTICKGAYFAGSRVTWFNKYLDLDIAVPKEAEVTIPKLISAINKGCTLNSVEGIFYKEKGSAIFRQTPLRPFVSDLDSLPFPALDLLDNELYVRPDTNVPQTTIQVARGCPYRCSYCLSSAVYGEKLRLRSPKNIADEIQSCIDNFDIRNYFLRADTFTYDKHWSLAVCKTIIKRKFDIEWVTTGHVDAICSERIDTMRRAGCWLVSLGIESGDETILQKVKPSINIKKIINSVLLCKKHGMMVYGFFIIGFPWETEESVLKTLDLIDELDLDFIEIHLLLPYPGTKMYDTFVELNLISDEGFSGYDHFQGAKCGTLYLTNNELLRFRSEGLKKFYFRPGYVCKTLGRTKNLRQFCQYTKYAYRLMRNLYFPSNSAT